MTRIKKRLFNKYLVLKAANEHKSGAMFQLDPNYAGSVEAKMDRLLASVRKKISRRVGNRDILLSIADLPRKCKGVFRGIVGFDALAGKSTSLLQCGYVSLPSLSNDYAINGLTSLMLDGEGVFSTPVAGCAVFGGGTMMGQGSTLFRGMPFIDEGGALLFFPRTSIPGKACRLGHWERAVEIVFHKNVALSELGAILVHRRNFDLLKRMRDSARSLSVCRAAFVKQSGQPLGEKMFSQLTQNLNELAFIDPKSEKVPVFDQSKTKKPLLICVDANDTPGFKICCMKTLIALGVADDVDQEFYLSCAYWQRESRRAEEELIEHLVQQEVVANLSQEYPLQKLFCMSFFDENDLRDALCRSAHCKGLYEGMMASDAGHKDTLWQHVIRGYFGNNGVAALSRLDDRPALRRLLCWIILLHDLDKLAIENVPRDTPLAAFISRHSDKVWQNVAKKRNCIAHFFMQHSQLHTWEQALVIRVVEMDLIGNLITERGDVTVKSALEFCREIADFYEALSIADVFDLCSAFYLADAGTIKSIAQAVMKRDNDTGIFHIKNERVQTLEEQICLTIDSDVYGRCA